MNVKVEGIGTLKFPDGTDEAVIQSTVNSLILEKKNKPRTFMEKYLPSVKRTGEIYMKEVGSGEKAMNTALEDPTGRNILKGFLGAIQYGFSPLTAAVKGIVREPIQEGLESAGVPKGAAEFAGEMVETGAYFLPYGKMVQSAIVGKEALETAKTVEKISKTLPKGKTTTKPLQFPEGLEKEAITDAQKPISAANQKVLKTQAVDDIANELRDVVGRTWDPSEKRITQEIADYMVSNPKEIERIATAYNLSPAQLTAQIKETMTIAGRDLGRMGILAREIKKKFNTPYMKQLSEFMDKEAGNVADIDKFGRTFKTVENVRRSALVSQFATTMRNIFSQGMRLTLGSIDDAFQGAANAFLKSGGEGVAGTTKETLKGIGQGLDAWTAVINRLKPSERMKLVEILNTENAIVAKSKMFSAPVHDVVLTNKISKALNYFNTAQEYFFRNIAFEARLRQLVRNAGLDIKTINPSDIPESMLKSAADYALEMTFASMPKSTFGKDWVKSMSNPIMTAFVNPFPRFLYGNALPFLKNFSPIGYLEALKPQVVADIVSGNPEKFAKAISQATLGTIMLNTAFHVRNSKNAGEKWYEIKIGDKTYDSRAYAPFSTYLFLAESLQNPEKIKPADYGMALLSLNRIGGTGLVIADVMRGETAKNTINIFKRMAGAYLSGFSVPARTVKDIYSSVDPNEAVIRDIKEDEFYGPTKQNIPGLSQTMPAARSPLQSGDIKTEAPVLRQATGISYRIKNQLQKEVDSIQLPASKIYPKTGSAELDRQISERMNILLEKTFPILSSKKNYKKMDDARKRIVLGKLFEDARRNATKFVMERNPQLAIETKINKLPRDIKTTIESIKMEEKQKQIPMGKYKTPMDVKQAVQNGTLSEADAEYILIQKFGMEQ